MAVRPINRLRKPSALQRLEFAASVLWETLEITPFALKSAQAW